MPKLYLHVIKMGSVIYVKLQNKNVINNIMKVTFSPEVESRGYMFRDIKKDECINYILGHEYRYNLEGKLQYIFNNRVLELNHLLIKSRCLFPGRNNNLKN